MSTASAFQEGVAIRGGVPVVFPQFSNQGTLPKHGFSRNSEWRLLKSDLLANGTAQAIYELRENIARLTIWPHVFRTELRISLSDNAVQLEMDVENTGDTNFSFTTALHTYLAVANIADVSLHGLQGLYYRDTVTGADHCLENEPALYISGETDRIYGAVPSRLELRQPHQTTVITSHGFADAVVWNPGSSASKLNDMETGGENRMLCVEAATILRPINLMPGDRWSGSQRLEVIAPGN